MVERGVVIAGPALGAGKVVEHVRVVRDPRRRCASRTSIARSHSPVVQKRSASAERSHGETENGTPGRPPITRIVVAASSATALRRVRGSFT